VFPLDRFVALVAGNTSNPSMAHARGVSVKLFTINRFQ
jgi:hypothetical protein